MTSDAEKIWEARVARAYQAAPRPEESAFVTSMTMVVPIYDVQEDVYVPCSIGQSVGYQVYGWDAAEQKFTFLRFVGEEIDVAHRYARMVHRILCREAGVQHDC